MPDSALGGYNASRRTRSCGVGSLVIAALVAALLLLSAGVTSLVDGGGSDLDVLLGRDSDHEGGDVDELLSDGDVSLSNHDSGVVHTVGELPLGNEGLQSSLHELVHGKSEDEIELPLVPGEQAELDDSSNESVSLEDSSGVVNLEGEEISGSLSELCEGELDSPDLSLVLKSVSADDLELVHESVLIEGLSRGLEGFTVVCVFSWHVEKEPIDLSAIV
mmetsp:Transcript_2722/g.4622  ORF Transcript_2722/g.4622 Transcript_2722/m.4622 type:complete len:219 (+) Transcript_2722:222-878(+)|eukprot:CAMPEP_0168607666 /NCGR_PEP_ID=MMETSP0449_2-20121227/183_1 /TAXON_ID=1082188 /ORGANISM="Strombidium rassoulzadegani, Strain ras09" /LENGTH=218 /DNA_ID=CAMNT_0008647535 /DNA_START=195 /DNA_END=851 /DNA_ORIENTATION=-